MRGIRSGDASQHVRRITALVLPLLLAACATSSEPGWHGERATAFGTARAVCEGETADASRAEHDFAYNACMARHGWTRGR